MTAKKTTPTADSVKSSTSSQQQPEKSAADQTPAKKPTDAAKSKKGPGVFDLPVNKVVVHPLVLLSVVDHYTRVTKNENVNRVVGVLLGSVRGKVVDVSNSFALPFDETDPNVWFLDQDYLEACNGMYRRVNARENIVGWYHTGPKLNPNDISINELIKRYSPHSVLVIVDVQPKADGLPTKAYVEVEEVHDDGTPPTRTFEHVLSEIGAEDAEEVGVEHLLRDIKDQTAGTLSQRVTDKYVALRGLEEKLSYVTSYLHQVSDGKLPINHKINGLLQDALNLMPNVLSSDFVRASNVQLNDEMSNVYLGSLARSVTALHDLINNKISLRDAEKAADAERGTTGRDVTSRKDDTAGDFKKGKPKVSTDDHKSRDSADDDSRRK